MKYAIIKTGGKQYLVRENDEIVVDYLKEKSGKKVNFETLACWEEEGKNLKIGQPTLEEKVEGKIIENLKGEKIRVARFKAKVRYRRTKGFRPLLSKVKIVKI